MNTFCKTLFKALRTQRFNMTYWVIPTKPLVKKKEARKRSANHLLESQGMESITSQCKRNQYKDMILNKLDPFGFCGKHCHGKNPPVISGSNTVRLTMTNAITVTSWPMTVCIDSNRRTKESNTVHQTLKCQYLIVCALPTSHRISTLHLRLYWITMFLTISVNND